MDTFFRAFLILILYYFFLVAFIPIVLKTQFKAPRELVRKFQHIAYAASFAIYLYVFESWAYAVIAIIFFIILAFFVLLIFEKTSYYTKLLVDRKKRGGEMKYSLIQAQAMFAILLYLFYYLLPNDNEIIAWIAVVSWGIGDALAALLGKRFGKRKHDGYNADPKKTYVGSISLNIAVLLIVFSLLALFSDVPWIASLIIAIIVSPLATVIEAYAKRGTDTTFLPIGIALMVYGLLFLFNIMGLTL